MAKGKQAVASVNRRLVAANGHIDRLTSELVDAKIRARDAERRADRLEGIERMLDRADVHRDELIIELTRKCQWWAKVAKEDRERRGLALREMGKLASDHGIMLGNRNLPFHDMWDFLVARYPAIMAALNAGTDLTAPFATPGTPFRNLEERLESNPESLKAFQRLAGERGEIQGHEGKSAGQVLADMLEASQAGFTPSETLELVLGSSER